MNALFLIYILSLLFALTISLRIPTHGDVAEIIQSILDNILGDDSDTAVTFTEDVLKIPKWWSTPEQCHRDCRLHSSAKTCYYSFMLEYYTVNGGACQLCNQSASDPDCQCILADGFEKTILVANRKFPGPSIQVCKGDTVVIDVKNHMDGSSTTIHWHGILQKGSPFYDGVPYVTQCPIHYGNTFRYKWKAENEGTHFWHSHVGFQKIDGVTGSIIVRNQCDPHKKFYDFDSNVLMIHDWMHELGLARFPGRLRTGTGQSPDNLLINGKGFFAGDQVATPIEVFEVIPGKRYRFRIIAALATTCPIQFAIQSHKLLAITTDGEPFEPVEVDTIRLFSAERYDVIVTANQERGSYWIQVKTVGLCVAERITQLAILKYKNSDGVPSTQPPTYEQSIPEFNGKILNPADGICNVGRETAVCVSELTNSNPLDPRILKEQPDVKIFLPFRFLSRNISEVFAPNTYDNYLIIGGQFYLTAFIDGISFESPASPLIIQFKEGREFRSCNGERKPKDCGANCVCTHVISLPYNGVIEITIVDEVGIPNLNHPFHLHGHAFHVIAEGLLDDPEEKIDLKKAVELDMNEKIQKRLEDAPNKDTIAIPTNGYVVIRFIADNPGFWFFHCHFMYHMVIGMEMVFQVGNRSQIPGIPKNFPRCGNFYI